jgi:hypothetical protein
MPNDGRPRTQVLSWNAPGKLAAQDDDSADRRPVSVEDHDIRRDGKQEGDRIRATCPAVAAGLLAEERKIQRHAHHRREQTHEHEQCESFSAPCLDGFHTVS